MKTVAIIPARMASSRFPGKPLKEINGIPMINYVYRNCLDSTLIDDVYVATCDNVIKNYVESIGCKVIMTSESHQRATDRTAEAMLLIENFEKQSISIVVMVQGDEPMITGEMIDKSIEPLIKNKEINVVNLMTEVTSIKEFNDSNEIKVTTDNNQFALYFSRSPIPSFNHSSIDFKGYKQVCAIPFRRDYLLKFNSWPESNLEKAESIDMLRLLDRGEKVKMVCVEGPIQSVDTQSDLDKVQELILTNNNIRIENNEKS